MKRSAKALALSLLMLLALCLMACGKYISSYKAVGFVHSNTSGSAYMSFYSFEGRMAFKLKYKSEEQTITAEAKLESGSAVVYYDTDGTKEEWFSISDGEKHNGSLSKLPTGTVYIIVETDGKCLNGDFDFKVK